jgi:hypothetical protein
MVLVSDGSRWDRQRVSDVVVSGETLARDARDVKLFA